jgi:hypothetical protein
MNYKLVMVGAILVTLGTTLIAASYFNLYTMVEASIPYPYTIIIFGRSYAKIDDIMGPNYTGIRKVGIIISGSQELQNILNSTLNYNTTLGLDPITITLSFGRVMSASVTPSYVPYFFQGILAVHYFDVPSYSPWSTITITNPGDNPVYWDVTVIHYEEVVNQNWLATLLIGIAFATVGIAITGIAIIRKSTNKQKET